MTTPKTTPATYTRERFEVHSRLKGRAQWFCGTRCKTLDEAKKAIARVGAPICGGIVSMGKKDAYEYTIVHVVSQCEVVHYEERML